MKGKFMLLGFFLVLMMSMGVSAQPWLEQESGGEEIYATGSLNIIPPAKDYYPLNQNISVPFTVMNGTVRDNTTINCSFSLRDFSGSYYDQNMTYKEGEFYAEIPSGTVEERGETGYRVLCQNDNKTEAGVLKEGMVFTNSPKNRDMTEKNSLQMMFGLGIVIFLLFYFAYKQDDNHKILRQVSIFFGMLGLLLVPPAITGNIYTSNSLFMNLIYTYFTIFMLYFVISLVYLLVTEKFPGVKGRIKL